jgi:GH24 family phage-related lysozyme (muramidase)
VKMLPEAIRDVKPHKKIFPEHVIEAEKVVRSLIRELPDNQFSALVGFVLTTSKGALARSILLQYVNDGNVFMAAKEFNRWVTRNGKRSKRLVMLRRKQAELFRRPVLVVNRGKDGGQTSL